MPTQLTTNRKPWEDRWQQPDPEVLLNVYEAHRHKILSTLLEQIVAYEGVTKTLQWHGESWKWCWQFDLHKEGNGQAVVMAYLVPNPEMPQICIPLDEELIGRLPMRRLNRYIRDGIRHAKCAVKVHWATWVPTAMTEAEQLMDLIKRKHKHLTLPKK